MENRFEKKIVKKAIRKYRLERAKKDFVVIGMTSGAAIVLGAVVGGACQLITKKPDISLGLGVGIAMGGTAGIVFNWSMCEDPSELQKKINELKELKKQMKNGYNPIWSMGEENFYEKYPLLLEKKETKKKIRKCNKKDA